MSASDITRRFEQSGYVDILVVCSAPVDEPPLELERELSTIKEEMQRASIPIRLIRVFPPTFAQLKRELCLETPRSQRQRAFHFTGHGEDDCLLFESEDGSTDRIWASQLCELFRENPIDFAVLNGCWSHSPRWEGICKVLTCDGGVRTAIGHRLEANDLSAIVFAQYLYHEIFRGSNVGMAMNTAVKALQDEGLYGGDQIRLSGDGGLQLGNDLAPRQGAGCFEDGMPRRRHLPDREFFRGRSDDILRISRSLAKSEHCAFGIWGMGGIGKTALALQVAHRNAWRYGEGGVAWVDARDLGSPTTHALCQLALERLLPEADPKCELIRHLESTPGMVVLDNLETLPESEYGSLARFLDQIPRNGSRAILISRIPLLQVDRLSGLSRVVLTKGLDELSGTNYACHLAETDGVRALCASLNERFSGHPQMVKRAVEIARAGMKAVEADLASPSGDLPTQLEAMVANGMNRAGEDGRRLLALLTLFKTGRFTLEEMETVCSVSTDKRNADPGNATSDRANDQPWLAKGLQQLMDGGLLESDREQVVYTFPKILVEYAMRVGPTDQGQGRKRRTKLLSFYLKYVRAHEGNNRAIDRCIDNALVLMNEILGEGVDWKDIASRRRMTRLIALVQGLREYFLKRGHWRLAALWHKRLIKLLRTAPRSIERDARLARERVLYGILLYKQGKIKRARNKLGKCIEREERRGNKMASLMALFEWIELEERPLNLNKDLVEKLRGRALEILRTLGEEGIEQ